MTGARADVLVTKDVAAKMMGCSVRTVERRLAAGDLTARGRERVAGLGQPRTMLSHDEVHRLVTGADPGQYELDL